MINAISVFKLLRTNKDKFSKQQYSTIKGQIIAGDISGAYKGINKILDLQKK